MLIYIFSFHVRDPVNTIQLLQTMNKIKHCQSIWPGCLSLCTELVSRAVSQLSHISGIL